MLLALGVMVALQMALLAAAVAAWVGPAVAEDWPSGPADEAIHLCGVADRLHDAARARVLERALRLATAAVAEDERDAAAHFAVFCALGKRAADRGVGLGVLRDLGRVRGSVDRVLEIDPDHVDALIGKAGVLLRLPRLWGGDPHEARRLLERAITLAPGHPVAEAFLAELGGVQPSGLR